MKENKGKFIQVRLDNPSDIFKFNHRFMDSFVYRGHANHEWKLVSSLYRFLDNYHPNIGNLMYSNMYEREMIKDFKYKYQAYTKNIMPNGDDVIEKTLGTGTCSGNRCVFATIVNRGIRGEVEEGRWVCHRDR